MASETASADEKKRFPLLPTYELALKCSNLFNILDARGAISVTERVGVIGRIRALAVGVAKAYAVQQTAEIVLSHLCHDEACHGWGTRDLAELSCRFARVRGASGVSEKESNSCLTFYWRLGWKKFRPG